MWSLNVDFDAAASAEDAEAAARQLLTPVAKWVMTDALPTCVAVSPNGLELTVGTSLGGVLNLYVQGVDDSSAEVAHSGLVAEKATLPTMTAGGSRPVRSLLVQKTMAATMRGSGVPAKDEGAVPQVIATAVRIFSIAARMYEPQVTVLCLTCGRRFRPGLRALKAAESLTRGLRTLGNQQSYFNDHRLSTVCTRCGCACKLNPFIIDNPLELPSVEDIVTAQRASKKHRSKRKAAKKLPRALRYAPAAAGEGRAIGSSTAAGTRSALRRQRPGNDDWTTASGTAAAVRRRGFP